LQSLLALLAPLLLLLLLLLEAECLLKEGSKAKERTLAELRIVWLGKLSNSSASTSMLGTKASPSAPVGAVEALFLVFVRFVRLLHFFFASAAFLIRKN
jgi:hypothetical protein